MAYIRKRMGKYQCVVRVSGYPTITKTFEHHKDAERFGKDLELKLFRGEYDLEKKKFPTFKDAFNRYKDEIIRKAIMTTQDDVKEIKETLKLLETRLYEITKEK
mgnify:CR=1 FL=1